ncbi:Hypothetical protein GbCGDNIH4_0445 [Granulibacter bethesdensis CGDNIH4]|nr:Hypothetical protein GbCGDNIH4_0445 [Granulibacter bethesdensis CGDNIH4]
MSRVLPCLTVLILAVAGWIPAVSAASHRHGAKPRADGAHVLGHFDDWTAATHIEAGETVCYAFTYAHASDPKLSGRSHVVLTVTERAKDRDAVAISAGYAYPPNATVHVTVDGTAFDFYTAQRSAFARQGNEAVAAFRNGRQAVARGPGPRQQTEVADTFSLRGFSAAYATILKACPSS